jgi:hypothetical protein
MKISFEPEKVICDDRCYYRSLFAGVGISDTRCHAVVMGELYRPTECEIDGSVVRPKDLEPFRSVKSTEQQMPWKYSQDQVFEVIAESQAANLRGLQEKVCDYAAKFRMTDFFCLPFIAHGLLYFNQDVQITLSEDELALEALGVACYGGKNHRTRVRENIGPEPKRLCDTYS